MLPEALGRALEGLEPPPGESDAARLGTLFRLLGEWERAGLTGFRGDDDLALGYFREALELRAHLPAVGPYLDVGSGGGTPALPLAAVGRGAWTLLEPRRTASTFLELAVRKLGIADRVTVVRSRLQGWLRDPAPVAGVTLRAVRLSRREWEGLAAALPDGARVVWPTSAPGRSRADLPEGLFRERTVAAARGIVWIGDVSRET